MIEALQSGIVAGLAIAVPVGAIGILIIETGIRRGFRVAWAAGAGTATADCVYAIIAAAFGAALAGVIEPLSRPLRIVAVAVLVALACRGMVSVLGAWRAQRAAVASEAVDRPPAPVRTGGERSARRTYLTFLGLTMMNPQTVIYFAALILGLQIGGTGVGEKAAFVAGAAGASLAWQSIVATIGAVLHRRLPSGFRVGVSLLGNALILFFAAVIARDLLG